jgi:hypothetical protein
MSDFEATVRPCNSVAEQLQVLSYGSNALRKKKDREVYVFSIFYLPLHREKRVYGIILLFSKSKLYDNTKTLNIE